MKIVQLEGKDVELIRALHEHGLSLRDQLVQLNAEVTEKVRAMAGCQEGDHSHPDFQYLDQGIIFVRVFGPDGDFDPGNVRAVPSPITEH